MFGNKIIGLGITAVGLVLSLPSCGTTDTAMDATVIGAAGAIAAISASQDKAVRHALFAAAGGSVAEEVDLRRKIRSLKAESVALRRKESGLAGSAKQKALKAERVRIEREIRKLSSQLYKLNSSDVPDPALIE